MIFKGLLNDVYLFIYLFIFIYLRRLKLEWLLLYQCFWPIFISSNKWMLGNFLHGSMAMFVGSLLSSPLWGIKCFLQPSSLSLAQDLNHTDGSHSSPIFSPYLTSGSEILEIMNSWTWWSRDNTLASRSKVRWFKPGWCQRIFSWRKAQDLRKEFQAVGPESETSGSL